MKSLPPKLLRALQEKGPNPSHIPQDIDSLMAIFENLEEKNLFLIQQGQENDVVIEEKRREFAELKRVKQAEI